jgi:uncharacterized protein (DUF488 family)
MCREHARQSDVKEGFTPRRDHAILELGKRMTAMALFTFGYEGLSIGEFIARLNKAGVYAVYDIRQMPLSRKKGFSKSAFSAALREAGIEYVHMPVFGCPRTIRDQYKADGNWRQYEKAFNAYLAGQADAVVELSKTARDSSICLVCFEADYNFCHRSLVARAVVGAGGPKVTHLTAKTAIPDLTHRVAA